MPRTLEEINLEIHHLKLSYKYNDQERQKKWKEAFGMLEGGIRTHDDDIKAVGRITGADRYEEKCRELSNQIYELEELKKELTIPGYKEERERKRKEKERREREEREKEERERKQKEEDAKERPKRVIGIILQICVTVVFFFILWGTDIFRWEVAFEDYEEGVIPFEVLFYGRFVVAPLAIGIISLIFHRESYGCFFFAIFMLICMVIITPITLTVYSQQVANYSSTYGIFNRIFTAVNTLVVHLIVIATMVIPGCVLLFKAQGIAPSMEEMAPIIVWTLLSWLLLILIYWQSSGGDVPLVNRP